MGTPPASHSVDAAIVRYVDATFHGYDRALAELAPALAEPRTADPARALARIALLVESLAGFAIGNAVGRLAQSVRRGFDRRIVAAVDDAVAQIAKRRIAAATDLLPPRRYLPDAARRPLADELATRLHVRLCRSHAETRLLVALLEQAIARVDPSALTALASTLDLLAADDTGMLAFGDQLELGWRSYAAIHAGTPAPTVDDTPRWRRGRDTWSAWSRRVRGDVPDDGAGYILRIG